MEQGFVGRQHERLDLELTAAYAKEQNGELSRREAVSFRCVYDSLPVTLSK
jgi:hypothetical protein